jgi:hypothetical protein
VPEIRAPSSIGTLKHYKAFSPSTPMNSPTRKPEEPFFHWEVSAAMGIYPLAHL